MHIVIDGIQSEDSGEALNVYMCIRMRIGIRASVR